MKVVLDASVAMSWLFQDERSPFSVSVLRFVRDRGAMVPVLWCTEMVHALLKSERRGRITAEQSSLALDLLRSLPIVVETSGEAPSFSEMTLARRFTLSAYDARYLDVASRYGLPLATRDERLAAAAEAMGLRWHPSEP